jgi:uncharacterized protein (DUF2141 family)
MSEPLALLVLLTKLVLGGSTETTVLEVAASGFHDARGHAIARLYRPGDDVVGTPWKSLTAEIHHGKASFSFEALAPGRYAVVVLHDLNDNGVIDHTFLRLPAEPLGFSNGFTLGVFSGKPTFEKLGFAIAGERATIAVQVR